MAANLETHNLTLPQGEIKGVKRETIYGLPYFSFEGIPFAKPPLGELRFKAPQPAEPWQGVLDCTNYKSKAKQNNELAQQIEGDEDCLYLNVYMKTLKSDKPLPVMVWIYGGGFYMGEATRELYSPDYFMREDVIFVTFNYRLDSLGFLSLKDPALKVAGNAGLKDQVLALKWIKQYISGFNGDPENITLFGESAGAGSTHYMCLTDKTRGVFQRAILMSGCVLNHWAHMSRENLAYRLAKHNGYEGENVDKDVLAYLQTVDPRKLVEHDILTDEEKRVGGLFAFGPITEPFIGDDCVVPKAPFEMLKTAWTNSIPMMIGGTSDEGLLMQLRLAKNPAVLQVFNKDFERFVPKQVRDKHSVAEIQAMSKKLRSIYFGDKDIDESTLPQLFDLFSYTLFWHGLHRTVLARLKYGDGAPTYQYRFAFDSPDFNLYRAIFCGPDSKFRGAAHADDLCYLFYFKFSRKLELDSDEYKCIQRMISIWTTFAKTGNPNCKDIKPSSWEPLVKANPFKALNISKDIEVVDLPEKSKLQVWNSFYAENELC